MDSVESSELVFRVSHWEMTRLVPVLGIRKLYDSRSSQKRNIRYGNIYDSYWNTFIGFSYMIYSYLIFRIRVNLRYERCWNGPQTTLGHIAGILGVHHKTSFLQARTKRPLGGAALACHSRHKSTVWNAINQATTPHSATQTTYYGTLMKLPYLNH